MTAVLGWTARDRKHKSGQNRGERCTQKRTYVTWSEAEEEAVQLLEDMRDGKLRILKGGNIFAYRCEVCGSFHVGHTPKPQHPFIQEYRP